MIKALKAPFLFLYFVTPQRGDEPRRFKDIDAETKVARKIGFIEISIKLSKLVR